jgi:hypothetical protein
MRVISHVHVGDMITGEHNSMKHISDKLLAVFNSLSGSTHT